MSGPGRRARRGVLSIAASEYNRAMKPDDLLRPTDLGLYCEAGDFYVDPWRPVDRAVITHAHADHARPGSRHYHASASSAPILRHRLSGVTVRSHAYGEKFKLGDAWVSLHPAGHILGSAQVRIEHHDRVWV